jgi:hypothetical protein
MISGLLQALRLQVNTLLWQKKYIKSLKISAVISLFLVNFFHMGKPTSRMPVGKETSFQMGLMPLVAKNDF